MRRSAIMLFLPALLLALPGGTLAAAPPAHIAAGAGYDLSWWTVDGGGCTNVTSGAYTLSGTTGQPDAGGASQGQYALVGGFWDAAAGDGLPSGGGSVFLPIVVKIW